MSNRIEQLLWFLANPMPAHDMDSKEAMTQWVGRFTNQPYWFIPTPFLVPRPSQLLFENFLVIKRNTVFHNVICRS